MLKWNEKLCKKIVENSNEGIIFSDREGIIRLWNRGAELIFGYTAEEALGKMLDIIIPDKHRARHWEGYMRVMREGSTRYANEMLSVPAIRKDGKRISIEFSVIIIRENDRIDGVAAIIRDVTSRWEKEKEMKQYIATLEDKLGIKTA